MIIMHKSIIGTKIKHSYINVPIRRTQGVTSSCIVPYKNRLKSVLISFSLKLSITFVLK